MSKRHDFLNLVYTFADAEDITRRHVPLWERTTGPRFLFVSPEDAPFDLDNQPSLKVGKSEHFGIESNRRTLAGLEWALAVADTVNDEFIVVYEYDSFFTSVPDAILPPPGAVATQVQVNHNSKYLPPKFPWFPQIWHRDALRKVVAVLKTEPQHSEYGFPDRFIGKGIWRARVPMHDITERAYSQFTIGPEHIPGALLAKSQGAVSFHGCKTQHIYRVLTAGPSLQQ